MIPDNFSLLGLELMSEVDLMKFTKKDLIEIVRLLVQDRIEVRVELIRIHKIIKKYLEI